MESKGFGINRSKTKYMEYEFSGGKSACIHRVTLQNQESPRSKHFKFQGSIVNKDGEIKEDVAHCVQVVWVKLLHHSGVLYDLMIPTKLKGKCNYTSIRLAMLFGIV